jgi:hypothetical protein
VSSGRPPDRKHGIPNAPPEPPAGPGEVEPRPEGLARRIVGAARDAASDVVDVASDVVDEASEIGGAAATRLRAARQRMHRAEGPAGRARRLRRLNREPLANLYELHPEARRAPRRELGLLTVPVSRIRGTAVDGPAQRGGDFLPFPPLKSMNWENRWQRIRAAQDRLEILPPVDLLQAGDGYWVTDGHNRVAAALYGGQDDIDASVTHLHLADSDDADVRTGQLAGVLEDSTQLRAAGSGRLSRGATARGAARPKRAARAPDPGDHGPSEPDAG